ncbi:MAG: ECF transporter S component [Parasporobacterium sp.]|nr:ECF transporter S component [Parasporobacterium sp.]
MKKWAVLDICLCAVSVALHIILELFLTIRIGNELKITLAALPFLVIAFICGPVEGFVTGLIGAFLSQLLTFGITVTTPFWILPYAMQGLVAGLIFKAFKNRISIRSVGIGIFASGFLSVILTWIASYLDGVVFFKYMTLEVLIGLIPIRLLVWAVLSVIYTAIVMPISRAVIKSCPAELKQKQKKQEKKHEL